MATSTFQFTGGTEGADFQVTLTHTAAIGTLVTGTIITSITCNSITFNLGASAFNSGIGFVARKEDFATTVLTPGDRLYEYISWRTQNTPSHPTSGKSFDMWLAQDNFDAQLVLRNLYNDNTTWSTLISAGPTYAVNPNAYSVVYDYDAQYAIAYKRGGLVNISYSP